MAVRRGRRYRAGMTRRTWVLLLAIVGALAIAGVSAAVISARGGDGGGNARRGPVEGAEAFNPHPIAGNFKPDDTRLESCSDRPCWEQAFGNLAYRDGPKAALAAFDRRIASDPQVEAACHRIAHVIGSAALSRFDGDVGKAFAAGSSSCWSGYYHGILERALVGVGTKAELGAAARRLCAGDSVRSTDYIAYQCIHGLGHGLMIHTGLDLPLSLETCDRLQTDWDQKSCTGGVFMENFNPSSGFKSRFVRDDDPVYPCPTLAERHKLYCYLQITDRLLAVSGYDWAATASACVRVEAAWRATCFQSYGRSASGYSRHDAAKLIELCDVPVAEWRSDCVYGAARDISSQDAGGARAGRFCAAVAVPLRARCFNGVGTILAGLTRSPDRLRELCGEITSRYVRECLLQAAA